MPAVLTPAHSEAERAQLICAERRDRKPHFKQMEFSTNYTAPIGRTQRYLTTCRTTQEPNKTVPSTGMFLSGLLAQL